MEQGIYVIETVNPKSCLSNKGFVVVAPTKLEARLKFMRSGGFTPDDKVVFITECTSKVTRIY